MMNGSKPYGPSGDERTWCGVSEIAKGCCESGRIGARMPTSARTSLGFFGQFADVGIRAPEQNGLLQQALAKGCCESGRIGARMPTSARTSLGFFGQFADVGIRAPEQNGLLQQALASLSQGAKRQY